MNFERVNWKVLLLITIPIIIFSQPKEEWVAKYNGPGDWNDEARAIAVDNEGNVYVTGRSRNSDGDYDYATIKYDKDGNEVWVVRYNGPGDWNDDARSITVDNEGNVYVTGLSSRWGIYYDYATIKYDKDGNELWVARYNGSGNGIDEAYSIVVDAEGNVYVTGRSEGLTTDFDYVTIKYDKNGNELWVARYDGPRHDYDVAYSIVVDTEGNVYVTGGSYGPNTGRDYATVKYDKNGNELWVKRYDGSGNAEDVAYSIAVNDEGDVFVTGRSRSSTGYLDYLTIKYDKDGNELWVKRYENKELWLDETVSIVLDAEDNVYVTGRDNDDYLTIKYDKDGNELWIARYDAGGSYDEVYGIAVDDESNVYITGRGRDLNGYWDYVTIKYDKDGNEFWVKRYNAGDGDDQPSSIAVDNEGNVYVTGKSRDLTYDENDYVTIKYDKDGNELWVARYNGARDGDDVGYAMTLDNEGNVYITGESMSSTQSFDYAIVKYDRDGNELWVARYEGQRDDEPSAITVDDEGNVYVTGRSMNSSENWDYVTIKYNRDGNKLWSARYYGLANASAGASAIAVDKEGNVYVTGTSRRDYTTIKYDKDGHQLWVRRYDSNGDGAAYAIAVDDEGNVYVTGRGMREPYDYEYVTIKYDRDGNELWIAKYSGYDNDAIESPYAMVVDDEGNVYVTGISWRPETGVDFATVKYDKDGNELWSARYNGCEDSDDEPSAIAVDDEGNVYVVGTQAYLGIVCIPGYVTIKYDKDGNEEWVREYEESGEGYDIAVDDQGNVYVTGESRYRYVTIKYDKDGNELWVVRYDNPNGYPVYRSFIAIDSRSNVYVAGTANNFNTGYDYVVIKYNQTEGIKETKTPSEFSFSFTKSNLTNNEVVIRYELPFTTNFSISVYDVSGRLVKTVIEGKKGAGSYTVKWDGKDLYGRDVSTGIYFIRFEAEDYNTTEKLILIK